ncbi:hypothetical protein DD237_007400 [Peronospora effusa]|uniref:Uncharacterized protein n=1 Tax=Peronospora effusa TaxID=542832 RepID=A0A3R7Y9Z4_9STRA|nr:hypothetical protein DD237_007400 [Peronospora effusa]
MTENVSEYETKRLRRIAENRQKLHELNIFTLGTSLSAMTKQKKRKREQSMEQSMEPTRKSARERKKQKLEKQQRKVEKRNEIEAKERKKLEKQQKVEAKERKRMEKEKRKLKKEKKLEQKLKKELQAKKRELKAKNKELKAKKQERSEKKKERKAKKKEDEKRESDKLDKIKNVDQEIKEQEPKCLDWRLRRKLQARGERKLATLKKRVEQKALRLKENSKLEKIKLNERKLRKKQKEKEKLERIVQKELELQRRMEEGEYMRQEDRLARQVAKEMVYNEKNKKRQEKKAMVNGWIEEIVTEEQKLARQKEDELRKVIYPIQKIDLPLVHISDPIDSFKTKPVVLSPFLNVDVNPFHAFSLGKQFLPPGKKSVMQGLCPGGFTTTFQDHVDIHVWKNAMTLFVSGTTGLFYEYMFEEATHHGKNYVFFRWTRTQAVTPYILSRMCQVQKGEEILQLNTSYSDVPIPTQKPESLLLFVQYPKGPYIYCGRLGYLGHQGLNFSLKVDMTDKVLSEYKVMRRRRMEENRQMLASLALPSLPRKSSRSQAPKAAVKLEPTRRSSRQRTRRETFKQHEAQQKVQHTPHQMQEIAIVAIANQQLNLTQQEVEKVQKIAKKKQKIDDRKFERLEKSKQRDMEIQVTERKKQQVIEPRKRQMERQEPYELPPEKVAKRNADIQKFIQEELDKQAYLAREQKQWDVEHPISRQEEMLIQKDVQEQIPTTGVVKEKKTGEITNEFDEADLMETVMGELEYEVML